MARTDPQRTGWGAASMADRCPRCGKRGFLSGEVSCSKCGWQDPILEPWVPSGWYVDPANPEKARYYSSAHRYWAGNARTKPKGAPIPTEPPASQRTALERERILRDPERAPIAESLRCRVLGGHGFGLQAGQGVELLFLKGELMVLSSVIASGASHDFGPVSMKYEQIVAFEIGGPGARRAGGGFVGGGFGLEGAAEGMLIASALNLLTTRTSIDTVVCIQTSDAELFLHHGETTPDALRMRLSPVFTILRQCEVARSRAAFPDAPTTHAVDRLAKLAEMLDRGLITDEEFARMKADLLE